MSSAEHKHHIPSGRVVLIDIIYWLISELHVKPLRADWESVLHEARTTY